ncbi:ATP-grasp domain-containing protein [Deinococcus sp. HMF7604]|uniref:ATP-grasp domain-containing protein n=1 Tax=Deinococcus betulae TaxID=2873312 RepID=UPI001CCE9DA2|nr:ATP-grasp domain-containing protein [Deinococcus betulae]MBZ9749772.1 ATP-grasp domain-containing protein [Deinococcus betulae]
MKVYFNKNFTGTADQLRALQYSGHEVVVSHTDPHHAMLDAARECGMTTLLEPKNIESEPYLDYIEDLLRVLRIDAFLPGKLAEQFAEQPERFPQAVVPAAPETLRLINNKGRFMADWPEALLPLPRWVMFQTLDEFDAGRAALTQAGVRLCMKPTEGIYASGFRILNDVPRVNSFLKGQLYEMSTAAAREMIAAADTWPEYLLMHTLEGDERSVDCAALHGDLLGCVVRRKVRQEQIIEPRPDLVEVAREMAHRYHLSGLFNFQTRDDRAGVPHLLEINTRASGGIRNALASGVNLPGLLFDALSGVQRPEVLTPTQTIHVREDKHARRA